MTESNKGFYRGFYLEVEIDREEDCIKRFHFAVDTATGKWHPIDYSSYSDPTDDEFKAIVDHILS